MKSSTNNFEYFQQINVGIIHYEICEGTYNAKQSHIILLQLDEIVTRLQDILQAFRKLCKTHLLSILEHVTNIVTSIGKLFNNFALDIENILGCLDSLFQLE